MPAIIVIPELSAVLGATFSFFVSTLLLGFVSVESFGLTGLSVLGLAFVEIKRKNSSIR